MKRLLPCLSVISILLSSLAFAQSPEFTFGNKVSVYDETPTDIVGVYNNQIIHRVFRMENIKLLGNNSPKANNTTLVYSSLDDLKKSDTKKFPVLKAKGLNKPEKAYIFDNILLKDTLMVFYQIEIDNQERLYAWPLEASTLTPYTPEAKLVGEAPEKGFKGFMLEHFKNHNAFLVSWITLPKSGNESTLSIKKVGHDLEKSLDLKFGIKGSKTGAGIGRSIITGDNTILTLIHYKRTKGSKSDDNHTFYSIVAFPEGAVEGIDTELNVSQGSALNCELYETKSGKLFASGTYLYKNKDKSAKTKEGIGVFVSEINKTDFTPENFEESPLTSAQYTNLFELPKAMENWKVIEHPDGSLTFASVSNYKKLVQSSRTSYYVYYSNSLVLTRISPGAKIEWVRVVPRRAFINSITAGVYPEVLGKGENVLVLFNDNEANVEILKTAKPESKTSSKKPASKKPSSSSKSKSKSVPAFEYSDEAIAKCKAWNLKNTFYRITEITPDGTANVSFVNSTEAHPENKSVLINTDYFYEIEEGEYISIGTEAGMLGPKSHCLMRLKL